MSNFSSNNTIVVCFLCPCLCRNGKGLCFCPSGVLPRGAGVGGEVGVWRKLFDAKTRMAIVETINQVRDNAVEISAS